MSHKILLTGASDYLGGSLLTHLHRTSLPPHATLYALVRNSQQANAVRDLGPEPLFLDLRDEVTVTKTIVDAKITIIYFLIDAIKSDVQITMIEALSKVKKQMGIDTYFLHTSGAKMFSQHAGFPIDCEISDADPELFNLSKTAKAPYEIMKQAVATNTAIIEQAEACGVRSYVFIPCIVYGEGEGFGNKISIQTTAVVQAALKAGAVYDVNAEEATWPVCHIRDNTALYVDLLRSILSGDNPGYGKNGYYLASSGSVAWCDIYAAMGKALAKRNVVGSNEVKKMDDAALKKIGKALGCPKELVPVQIGGKCTLKAGRASSVGWRAEYSPEHILEAADTEVELILKHLKD